MRALYVRFDYTTFEAKPQTWNFLEDLTINGQRVGDRWGIVFDAGETWDRTTNDYSPNTGYDYYEREVGFATFVSPGSQELATFTTFDGRNLYNWGTVYVPDGFLIPPGVGPGPRFIRDADDSGFSVSDASFSLSTNTVAGVSFGDFNISTADTFQDVLGRLGTHLGLGSLVTAVENVGAARQAVFGTVLNGTKVIEALIDNPNLTDAQRASIIDDLFHGAQARNHQALIDVTLFPGNPQAEQIADNALSAIQLVGQVGQTGVLPLSGSVTLGLAVNFFNVVTIEASVTGTATVDIVLDSERSTLISTLGGNDYVGAGIGNDFVYGGSGNDVLLGGSGDDLIAGGPGRDYLWGGQGIDTVDYSDSPAASGIDVNLLTGTGRDGFGETERILGFENVTGTDLADLVTGNNLANVIRGQGGNDTIDGRLGNDAYFGDAGDDIFILRGSEAVRDSFDAGETGETFGDAINVRGVDPVILAGFNAAASGIERWVGNNNAVLGTAVADQLDFSGLTSATGIAYVQGGSGNDLLIGTSGNDKLFGGADNDTLVGGGGNDTIDGQLGNDTYIGGAGDDIFILRGSEAVRDSFDAGETGETFGDAINVRGVDPVILAGFNAAAIGIEKWVGNNNAVLGTAASDLLDFSGLTSATGIAYVHGGSGNDLLIGTTGNDTLIGGADNDTLAGGRGKDILVGGAGTDFFVYGSPLDGGDRINDFVRGQDKILLPFLGGNPVPLVVVGASPVPVTGGPTLTFFSQSSELVYSQGSGAGLFEIATLVGVHNLSVSDFIF